MCIVTVLRELFIGEERTEQGGDKRRDRERRGGGRVCSHIKYRDTKQLMNYSFGNRYENKL